MQKKIGKFPPLDKFFDGTFRRDDASVRSSIPIIAADFHWTAQRDNRINGPPAHPSLFIVLSIQKLFLIKTICEKRRRRGEKEKSSFSAPIYDPRLNHRW